MGMAQDIRKGLKGGGLDRKACDVFESMHQGGIGKHPHPGGLFKTMNQGKMAKRSGKHMAGKKSPSINARMGQGGK